MLCQFQVYSKVDQLYTYIYPLFFRFFSHKGHFRVLSRIPCATQQVLVGYLFYVQLCVYLNPQLLIYPCPLLLSGNSAYKESACNAGDPDSIPGSRRFPGEGIGYPLQYPWTSFVAHLVKNPPAMWETWLNPWVGKIPWRREKLPTPVFWPGKFHGLHSPWGCKELDMTE